MEPLMLILKVWSTHHTSYLTIRMTLFCWFRLSITQHIHEAQNKYDWCTNTKILTRWLCVCSACCSVLFVYVNATTTKTKVWWMIRVTQTVDPLIFKMSWVVISSEKTNNCWSLVYTSMFHRVDIHIHTYIHTYMY